MNRKGLAVVAILGLAGLTAWLHRPALAWYHVYQLALASPEARPARAEKAAAAGEAALSPTLEHLASSDPRVCANMQAALELWAHRWPADDPRAERLASEIEAGYADYSPAGREVALAVLAALLRQDGPRVLPVALTRAAGEVLQAAAPVPSLRRGVLSLAGALVARVPTGQWLDTCRGLAEKSLADADPDLRAGAVQLILSGPLRQDGELLRKVVPLLRDPEPMPRRSALLALASAKELVSEDDLLPLLHDTEHEIQHLCEVALRSRGLEENHIHMARLISDPAPAARLQVLHRLSRDADLEAGVWLRRLSADVSPAVRAAAVRAATLHPHVNLRDRLDEMARRDPSESVRLNAQHYLRQLAARPSLSLR